MFSDFIIYVDESGDHGLENIDNHYPIFVLTFCVFRKVEYQDIVVPSFLSLKFQFFGHDMIVLHSHHIRKANGDFRILVSPEIRERFTAALEFAVARAPFTVIASVIHKSMLRDRYVYPSNPYEIALCFCLERAYAFLRERGQADRRTPVIVECRGKAEDDALELAFRRIVQGANHWGPLPFEIVFADKKVNSTGLQLADLVSYPIGRHYINPEQRNRAYETIEQKFRTNEAGKKEGWGLKCFP